MEKGAKMFGKKLRDLRTARGVTQREIAEYLGVSPSTVGMYEQDRRQPDIDTLISISKFYKVSLSSLCEIPPEPESENKRELLKLIDLLDYDQLKELESYVDYLILKHKKENGNNKKA